MYNIERMVYQLVQAYRSQEKILLETPPSFR